MTIDFTPTVWHDGVDGGTLVTAALLNSRETVTKSLVDTVNGLTSSTDPRREFAPENYGAAGDGVAVDRAAVQAAIDAANSRYTATGVRQTVPITGLYLLDSVNYTKTDGTVFGAVSLMLKDGVELGGPGTLKVKNGAYGSGAFYAAIRSISTGLSNAVIRDITIDGNKAGNVASTQCSNIVLEAKAAVDVLNVKSINANGNGIMVRGSTTAAAANIRIRSCTVTGASSIGIQVSQFAGLTIDGNTVGFCTDNGIDIYGEDGDLTPNGLDFTICNNRVRNVLVGLFLETVASGVVTGNYVRDSSLGASVNRINGQPQEINIVANTFVNDAIGVRVTGDTGGVSIRNNIVAHSGTACIQLGSGGNVSNVFVLDNTLDTTTLNTVPLVAVAGNQASFNRVRGTITRNTDRSKDVVVTATTSVGNVYSPANAA